MKKDTAFLTKPEKFENAKNIVHISTGYIMSVLVTGKKITF
jgi:hypothetical protein